MNRWCNFGLIISSTILILVASEGRLLERFENALNSAMNDDLDNGDLFIEHLAQILEEEEGLELVDRHRRSTDNLNHLKTKFPTKFDGSGDEIEEDFTPQLFTNATIISFTLGTTSTTLTKYTPRPSSSCRCEKGQKGDSGICPSDCGYNAHLYQQHCLNSKINTEKLTNAVRQLIIDAKKIALRNAQATGCSCPIVPVSTTTTYPSVTSPTTMNYNTYLMLKGEKGDPGTSCSPLCTQSSQSNIRIVSTVQQARDASSTYPDHTYVHVVDVNGRLQDVFINIAGRLVPIKIEAETPPIVYTTTVSTKLPSISPAKCAFTLPCSKLHIFALGPHVRRMCHPQRPAVLCSKLSEFDDLCGHVAERHQLKGFYRAFMSSSTQWLSNIFSGICVNAEMVNMKEETLFNSVDDIFQHKIPSNEILDVKGVKAQFQYWWHGSLKNGSASKDTCLDWSRQDSSLSGIASRLPDGKKSLFHYQYAWPCSISDSNMGILCIETNCDKRNFYKH